MDRSTVNARAIGLSVGLHVLLVGLLFIGLLFQRQSAPLSVAGGAIEAVLSEDLSMPAMPPPAPEPKPAPPAPPQPKETAPPPQPRPEPQPQDSPEPEQQEAQAPIERPDTVDQERVVREAAEQAERAKREQEERRRQEQVQLEEEQKREAERRQRLAEQQAERDRELAEIRRQREQAERQRQLEEEKLKQLADRREQAQSQNASAPSAPANNESISDRLGNQGVDDALLGRYRLAIQQQVDRNWSRPDNLRPGLRCYVDITQMVGGQVNGMNFSRCPVDELTKRSIEAALMREPLPYRGYESVYRRKLEIPFCYPVEVCE